MRNNATGTIFAGFLGLLLGSGQALAQSTGEQTSTTEQTAQSTVENDVAVSQSSSSADSSSVSIAGVVSINGEIVVSESAMALVDNTQIVDDNVLSAENTLGNVVTVGQDVLSGASGNIGLNVAAGDLNAQDNASSIAAVGTGSTGLASDGSSLVVQISHNNVLTGGADTINNQAFLRDSVLAGAQGNIGVNIVSGAFNVQKNALTVSAVAGDSVLASATAALTQQASLNQINHGDGTVNQVSLGGSALLNASGNIGVNIAAGSNNLQANSLNIASGN